jgi:hypoxanthine phosphoribosyltransferase
VSSAGTAAGPAEVPHEVLGWAEFGQACRELARQVAADGYEPDVILAVARGGLLPAAAVAYALDTKNVVAVNVEFYTGQDRRLDVPVMLPPFLTPEIIAGARVLVVDDVADTGGTLALVTDFCAAHVADVRCAVIYEKPRSSVRCSYVWRRTDRWIDFPWSAQPPVTRPR